MGVLMKTAIVVMTRNPGEGIRQVLEQVNRQSLTFGRRIVVDSNSTDQTCAIAKQYGFEVLSLGVQTFNHGGTREWCVRQLGETEVVIFLTQDAVLAATDSAEKLLAYFDDDRVGAAYGRQLPQAGASKIAAHARLFNYGAEPQLKTYADRCELGIKTPFLSDSYAAYRLSALAEAGGFPERVIVCEDMYAGAKLLMKGYTIAYAADAEVYHSHDYDLVQEFRRYFDTGVFQKQEPWIRETFGAAEGTGLKLVKSQLWYLLRVGAYGEIVRAILGNAVKFFGYRLGLCYELLPQSLCRHLSGQGYYFS